jgi:dTDP-4-amino-4,6-dideoxygalactose transaminase
MMVIEDAAHAFPSFSEAGFPAGTLGDAGVFSFYATKTITTGEGGMLVSRNPEIIERASIMRCHGIDRAVWNRYTDSKASWYYEVIKAGYKYNLPDILAAIGRAQLKRADDLWEKRKHIATRYDAAFSDDPRFSIPLNLAGDARHIYPLRLNALLTERLSRDDCARKLKEAGIGVSVHFIPLHTMPYYKERYNLKDGDFPNAENAYKRVISLPIWPGMTGKQIDRVIDSVLKLM